MKPGYITTHDACYRGHTACRAGNRGVEGTCTMLFCPALQLPVTVLVVLWTCRKKEVEDLINKIVEIPAEQFRVPDPNLYYR